MLTKRKEYYVELIKNSFSLSEVCRKSNISSTSGNFETLKKIILEEKIDVSHFKRVNQKYNKKRELSEYLSNNHRISTYNLKKRLLSEGVKEYICENCGSTHWLGKPIPLELHHLDGNHSNNNLANIQFLCANCHALTENYCGKNISDTSYERTCTVCGKKFSSKKAKYCSKECRCLGQHRTPFFTKEKVIEAINSSSTKEELCENLKKSNRNTNYFLRKYDLNFVKEKKVNDEFLKRLKKLKSFSALGRELGISDTAIRKRLKRENLPFKIQEILEYLNNRKDL